MTAFVCVGFALLCYLVHMGVAPSLVDKSVDEQGLVLLLPFLLVWRCCTVIRKSMRAQAICSRVPQLRGGVYFCLRPW